MSNFSANHLFLKWNPPGGNTTLNHYRVVINGHQQQTFGSVPEIYWNKKLTPGIIYNVTIVAVSYGDLFSGPWYGSAESKPVVDWIETDTGKSLFIIYINTYICSGKIFNLKCNAAISINFNKYCFLFCYTIP